MGVLAMNIIDSRVNNLCEQMKKLDFCNVGSYVESVDGFTYFTFEDSNSRFYRCKFKVIKGKVLHYVDSQDVSKYILDAVKEDILEVIFNLY